MKVLMRFGLAALCAAGMNSARAATVTLTLTPAPSVSGAAGSTVGWGYSIYNGNSSWLETLNLTSDIFSSGTPTSVFDFPVIAPYSTVQEAFTVAPTTACPTGNCGLFELLWDPSATAGMKNVGKFTLSSEFFGTNPLTDPTAVDLGAAPDATAAYSATVSGTAAVTPEPASITLLLLGVSTMVMRRRSFAREVMRATGR